MPNRITSSDKVESVVALASIDASTSEIAELTDIAKSTVIDILAGKGGWRERLKDPSFAPFRASIKRKLQAGGLVVAAKALLQAERDISNARAKDAAIVYGVMRDKERLDAGEATSHVAVLNRHEIAGRSEALRNLLASMGLSLDDVEGSGHAAFDKEHTITNNEYPQANTDAITNTTERSFEP